MIISQDALDRLECESLVQVLELEKVWPFRVVMRTNPRLINDDYRIILTYTIFMEYGLQHGRCVS